MSTKLPDLGDVVHLKSGSPLFVVVETFNSHKEAKVAYWKSDIDGPAFFKIETVALEKVPKVEPTQPKAKRTRS